MLKCTQCQFETIFDVPTFSYDVIPQRNSDVSQLLADSFQSSLTKACCRCNKDTVHFEDSDIQHSPSILVIVIKRFNFTNSATKNHDKIKIENRITINHAEFDFLASVQHFGMNTSSGHYTSIVKYGNEYFQCNDSNITKK